MLCLSFHNYLVPSTEEPVFYSREVQSMTGIRKIELSGRRHFRSLERVGAKSEPDALPSRSSSHNASCVNPLVS